MAAENRTPWHVRLPAGVLIAAALGACSSGGLVLRDPSAGDTDRYIVIGFGVVSVPRVPACARAVTATHAETYGVLITTAPGARFVIGYGQADTTTVNRKAGEILVEVERRQGRASVTVRRPDGAKAPEGSDCS